ncbi:MAG: aryl-sulfate sulfotransferase [Ignavibacteriales bacterium]|nr:aryl-sulfate sulfotransferase [Ignavibacteriales bacterium]
MKQCRLFIGSTLLILALCTDCLFTQTRTIGLLLNDSTKTYPGYTLFTPLKSTKTFLIDMNGMLVRSWTSPYYPGQAVMLLKDGSILRAAMIQQGNPFQQGGVGGRNEKYNWNGTLTWSFDHYGTAYSLHHDFEVMPNGNILMIAWEKKTNAEAAAAGRNLTGATYTEVWSEKVIEVQPSGTSGGTIIWEWHIWDHLVQDYDATKSNYGVVSQHPELYSINYGDMKADWLHFNALRYNPVRDEIMVSLHATSEFLVIDHSTTSAQAAGHTGGRRGKGGDILYRWGNPVAYKLGTAADQKLFSQHDARWIEEGLPGAGNITIFNNGTKRPEGLYSSIEQIVPPIGSDSSYTRTANAAFGPASAVWQFVGSPTTSFYGENISGASRLPNGNTIICQGPSGKFFEVTSNGQIVWTYVNPVSTTIYAQGQTPVENLVFKVNRYASTYAGLAGKTLTPIGPIETYPSAVEDRETAVNGFTLYQNYPNPFNPSTVLSYDVPAVSHVTLKVYNLLGEEVVTLVNEMKDAGSYSAAFNARSLPSGLYIAKLTAGAASKVVRMVLMK